MKDNQIEIAKCRHEFDTLIDILSYIINMEDYDEDNIDNPLAEIHSEILRRINKCMDSFTSLTGTRLYYAIGIRGEFPTIWKG